MPMRARVWLLTTATFLFFAVVAWALGPLAGEDFTALRTVQSLVAVLGLLAAVSVFRFLSTRWKGRIRGEKAARKEDRLASTFKAARKRLAASPKAEEKNLRKLPTILILGPRGSTKTTVVENSGLDLELLAGETRRGDTTIPTEIANLWYAQGTVLVEAGGALVDTPEKWEALLSHTQPARLRAALGLEEQSPRVALVCVGCDEFTQPGAGETVTALARKLRDRLVEAAQALGIRLPVYVLFTRADRLPFYEDFVRSLDRDEAAQALGATLPIPPEDDGSHADTEGARIDRYLGEMLHALSLKRRELLLRERDADTQAGVYEFPRELEKIRTHVRSFLIELCRPSQLGRSPFLRSFHFTGVRALVVDDAAAAPRSTPDPTDAPAIGATAVFDMAKLQAAAAARSSVSRSRRIPDWAFLKPFFRGVVLPDEAARVTTTGGARVDVLRRGLLTLVALVATVWIVGLVVSYRGNRAIAQRVASTATAVREAQFAPTLIPTEDVLLPLDTLRAELAELRRHELEGRPPLRLRWGLYRGDDVLEPGIRVWLEAFEASLGVTARQLLLDRLAGLPDAPTEASEYEETYDALKAYLIVTDHPARSTVAFLPGAILANWSAARNLDEARGQLLRRQLDFFADVIRDGNPTAGSVDATVVASARGFLAQFGDADRFYQTLLADAGTVGEEIRLSVAVPESATLLRNDVVVPAHFTLAAWDHVRELDLDRFFSSEDWVLAGEVISPQDRAALQTSLVTRYQSDYARTWLDFLQSTSVLPFGNAADAANRLGRLADAQSALLQALALVSANTLPLAAADFQPVHQVQPPDSTGILIGPGNQPYVGALANLQANLDQVANATGPGRTGALQQANQAVLQATQAVGGIAQGFARQTEMAQNTGTAVRRLLEEPIRQAEALVGALPSAELNGRGASFCRDFNALLSGYPFQATSGVNADIENVIAALKPNESALWAFYQDALQGVLQPQGNRYVARSGADPAPNPAFVQFFNRAADASSSLFDAQGNGPRVDFQLIPQTSDQLPSVTVVIDGQSQTITRTSVNARPFAWEGARARDARITGLVGGAEMPLVEVPEGPWALFRLFELADWENLGGFQYRLRWNTAQGLTLNANLNLATSAPIFQRAFLDGLTCVSRVAR